MSRRRTRRKGDQTESALLETAERLLAERPLSDIPVDELAAGAGISRPTFYFYFESREALLAVLAERLLDELYRAADVWFRRSDESPADAVRRAHEATLAVWRRHGPVLRATVRARDVDLGMGRFWDDVRRRFIDAAADQIERERAAGVAVPGPPDARSLASVLIAMNENVCYNASLKRRTAERDRETVDTLTAVWLRAVYGMSPWTYRRGGMEPMRPDW